LTRASYGFASDQHALFCKEQKHLAGERTLEVVDVVSTKCEHTSCDVTASQGFKADMIRRRCKQHALPGMVHVANATCEGCHKCIRSAGYKLPNDKVSTI
jgi:hypothetical protein